MEHAAIIDREDGAPEAALRLYQLATAKLLQTSSDNPRVPVQQARLHTMMARCYALLHHPDHARKELAAARALPRPADRFERAEMEGLRARVALDLGELDVAHQYAVTSVQAWDEHERRDGALSRITLAIVHVTTGERDASDLTARAVEAVEPLRSQRLRTRLQPLERALRTRRDSTSLDLAERTRSLQVGRAPAIPRQSHTTPLT